MAASFYLTLSSNSSMEIHPENTAARFIVHLPRELTLRQEFEFALVEMHYPCTLYNVRAGQNLINIYVGGDALLLEIKPGYYATRKDLTGAINSQLDSVGMSSFIEDTQQGYLEPPFLESAAPFRFHVSESLALQLGFDPCLPLVKHAGQRDVKKSEIILQKASRAADPSLGLPSMMLVYCDLAEPQLYSNVVTPVIRTVSIDKTRYKYGNMACRTYDHPIYIPVVKHQFHAVEVNIRETPGALMPFAYGTSTLVLHFRPRSA